MNEREPGTRGVVALRAVILVDAVVFLTASLLNAGIIISLGFTEMGFAVPIWQAGIGEAVIGLVLLIAAATERATLSGWLCGCRSLASPSALAPPRYRGPHATFTVSSVPLALIILGLLMWIRQQGRRLRHRSHMPGTN